MTGVGPLHPFATLRAFVLCDPQTFPLLTYKKSLRINNTCPSRPPLSDKHRNLAIKHSRPHRGRVVTDADANKKCKFVIHPSSKAPTPTSTPMPSGAPGSATAPNRALATPPPPELHVKIPVNIDRRLSASRDLHLPVYKRVSLATPPFPAGYTSILIS